jgi:hypothetical protein
VYIVLLVDAKVSGEHAASIISDEVALKNEEHAASIFRVVVTIFRVPATRNMEAECNFGTKMATSTTARCHNLDDYGLNIRNL